MTGPSNFSLLLVDDDELDHELMREALKKSGLPYAMQILSDGDVLLPYLLREGPYANVPPVHLVLLDLNMPGRNGRDLLGELKRDPRLRYLPVVLFTSSWADADIASAYELGANAVIIKPVTFAALIETLQTLTRFWFQTAVLHPDLTA